MTAPQAVSASMDATVSHCLVLCVALHLVCARASTVRYCLLIRKYTRAVMLQHYTHSLTIHTVQELNVHWLRSNVGLVTQEPVLFAGTIMDNILRGSPGASEETVHAAAAAASAHDFITAFTDGYATDVGEQSSLLSGGQKQRIAIAVSTAAITATISTTTSSTACVVIPSYYCCNNTLSMVSLLLILAYYYLNCRCCYQVALCK
jgi:ABC-type polar amino acid transport system ATPase subunit